MTLRHEAHKVCVVVRAYPTAMFWILGCASLYAASEGNSYALVPLLVVQFVVAVHVVRRMWSPPIVISIKPETGRIIMPTQPRAPRIERHRHVRH